MLQTLSGGFAQHQRRPRASGCSELAPSFGQPQASLGQSAAWAALAGIFVSFRPKVLWGDEWYQGVGGASRLEDGVWITRVAYKATGAWRKCSSWHNLANETWERIE